MAGVDLHTTTKNKVAFGCEINERDDGEYHVHFELSPSCDYLQFSSDSKHVDDIDAIFKILDPLESQELEVSLTIVTAIPVNKLPENSFLKSLRDISASASKTTLSMNGARFKIQSDDGFNDFSWMQAIEEEGTEAAIIELQGNFEAILEDGFIANFCETAADGIQKYVLDV